MMRAMVAIMLALFPAVALAQIPAPPPPQQAWRIFFRSSICFRNCGNACCACSTAAEER